MGKDSVIRDSIVMPNARVGRNTVIEHAIVGEEVVIGDNCHIGYEETGENKLSYLKVDVSGLTVIG